MPKVKSSAKERWLIQNDDVISSVEKADNIIVGRVIRSCGNSFVVSSDGHEYTVRAKGNLALADMIAQAFKDTKLSPDMWPIVLCLLPDEALAVIRTQEQLNKFKEPENIGYDFDIDAI